MAMLPSSFTTIIDEAQRMIRNEYFIVERFDSIERHLPFAWMEHS